MARVDPFGNYNFTVVIDGVNAGCFQSVSGLSHEIEVLSHQEGGVNDRQHKLPGQGSYPNIVLKVGFINDGAFEGWHFGFVKKPSARKLVTITLNDNAGKEVKSWSFNRCWPVKWEGPELSSDGAEIAIETLEIAHEGLV